MKFWAGLAGTSVGVLLSSRTESHGGVERRVMRARCLAHHFRDGTKACGSFYGDPSSITMLGVWMAKQCYVGLGEIRSGQKVVGNVPRSQCAKPYPTGLTVEPMDENGRKVWVARA